MALRWATVATHEVTEPRVSSKRAASRHSSTNTSCVTSSVCAGSRTTFNTTPWTSGESVVELGEGGLIAPAACRSDVVSGSSVNVVGGLRPRGAPGAEAHTRSS